MKKPVREISKEIFDVAVIGAGASGSVAVQELTSKGLKVALLDAGAADTEKRNDNPKGWLDRVPREYPIQSRSEAFNSQNENLFVKDTDLPYSFSREAPFFWIRSRALGGRMNLWTGECFRLSDLDFKAASNDGLGIDWPITHDELDPDYRRAEKLLAIRAHRDRMPSAPDGEIVEGEPLDQNEAWVHGELRRLGAPVILDRLASTKAGKPPNLRELIHQAESTGKLSHFPRSIVKSLDLGKNGLIGSVTAIHARDQEEFRVRARSFVLCASTVESTRILLNSGLSKTRGHKVLGLYLNDHIGGPKSLMIEGVFNDRGTPFESASHRILYIPRYQNLSPQNRVWPYRRGYTTRVMLERVNQFQVRFTLTAFGEPLSYAQNKVELDPARLDRWGIPAARIRFETRENERRMFECMKWDLKKIAEQLTREKGSEISNSYLGRIEPGLCNHEVGTARMGSDPDISFLNSHSRAHDIENLYVTDGSGFTSLGTANPTLTLMALTYRACRDLTKRI